VRERGSEHSSPPVKVGRLSPSKQSVRWCPAIRARPIKYWRSFDDFRKRRVPRVWSKTIFPIALRIGRRGIAAQIPDADGSVHRLRGRLGHAPYSRPKRLCRTFASRRISFRQAPVLRDGKRRARRNRRPACWPRPSGTVPPRSKQPQTSGEPRRDRHFHAGERADALRSPDRSQTVTRNGYIATWGGFISP